jgi:hypothetical protein
MQIESMNRPADEIVAVARRNGTFHWYRSSRELWVLDLNKWTKDFTDSGIEVPESDPLERFGIPVVNDMTMDRFLDEMKLFEVSKQRLTEQLESRLPTAHSVWDVLDLFPIVFVDFDRRHLCAFYPEGIRIERYIPKGWTSEFEDFMVKYPERHFPRKEKFWITDKMDILQALNARGQENCNLAWE